MRSLRGTRTAVIAVIIGALAAPLLGGTGGATAPRDRRSQPALSDGQWVGRLAWSGVQSGRLAGSPLIFDEAPFMGDGSMAFTVQGEQLLASTFSMQIRGSVTAHGEDTSLYTGDRNMSYSGIVSGVPEAPCLQGQYDISGTVLADTPAGRIEVTLSPGEIIMPVECGNMPLELTNVACDVASGTFAPYFGQENAAYGLRLSQQATFTLFRAGDNFTPDEAEQNASLILVWVNRLNSEVPANPRVLRNLLSEIDRFFGDTFRNEECGRLGNGATVLADAVRTMTLGYLARNPAIELGELVALLRANYRVGNFSWERDTDPLARRVRNELYSTLDDFVDGYERGRNSDALEDIETIAREFGWNRIAQRAQDAWGRLNDG